MTMLHKKRFSELKEQMENLLNSKSSKHNELLGRSIIEIDGNSLLEWKVKTRNLLSKACGQDSEHYFEFLENQENQSFGTNLGTLERLRAIFLAAMEDFEGGYLQSTRSLIQAEVFDTELEQASELLKGGYKLPAAVVAGVVLETTLRELCNRANIAHGKLDKMNTDLCKNGIYNMLQQKRITTLAEIRNSAAHGHPEKFTDHDVEDMIRDVARFANDTL